MTSYQNTTSHTSCFPRQPPLIHAKRPRSRLPTGCCVNARAITSTRIPQVKSCCSSTCTNYDLSKDSFQQNKEQIGKKSRWSARCYCVRYRTSVSSIIQLLFLHLTLHTPTLSQLRSMACSNRSPLRVVSLVFFALRNSKLNSFITPSFWT